MLSDSNPQLALFLVAWSQAFLKGERMHAMCLFRREIDREIERDTNREKDTYIERQRHRE